MKVERTGWSIRSELDTRHRRRTGQAAKSPLDMTNGGLSEAAGPIGARKPKPKKFMESSVDAPWPPRTSTSANSAFNVRRHELNSTDVTDCRVCQSNFLQRANELIMLPRALPAIAPMMPESGLTAQDLSGHLRVGHVRQPTQVSQ